MNRQERRRAKRKELRERWNGMKAEAEKDRPLLCEELVRLGFVQDNTDADAEQRRELDAYLRSRLSAKERQTVDGLLAELDGGEHVNDIGDPHRTVIIHLLDAVRNWAAEQERRDEQEFDCALESAMLGLPDEQCAELAAIYDAAQSAGGDVGLAGKLLASASPALQRALTDALAQVDGVAGHQVAADPMAKLREKYGG